MIIISIIFIFVIHYLINFLKSTLTVPKLKDLVNAPPLKYENMYNIINQKKYSNDPTHFQEQVEQNTLDIGTTPIDMLTNDSDMKNELKDFLRKQMN